MNKSTLIVGVVAVTLASCGEAEKEEEPKALLPNVQAEEIVVQDFEHWVELQGSLQSENDVMLTPEMGGVIRSIRFKDGDEVKKGQTIAVIDSDIISKNIDEVEVGLENAYFILEKQRALYQKGVGTAFDTTQAYNQVKSLVKKRQTLLAQAGKSIVTAPFSGVIEDVRQKEGEVGAPQIPLCHLVGLTDLTAKASISEAYLKNIGKGSRVQIEIPALDTLVTGLTVDRVSHYVNPMNRTYTVHIDIDNESESLLPNLVTRIKVMDKEIEKALVVPASAVQFDKDGNTYVFRLKEKEDHFVSELIMVDVLSSYNGMNAIDGEGLSKSDLIVTVGGEGIEDNTEVNRTK